MRQVRGGWRRWPVARRAPHEARACAQQRRSIGFLSDLRHGAAGVQPVAGSPRCGGVPTRVLVGGDDMMGRMRRRIVTRCRYGAGGGDEDAGAAAGRRQGGEGENPLHCGAARGRMKAVRGGEAGANMNAKDATGGRPLMWAQQGQLEKALVESVVLTPRPPARSTTTMPSLPSPPCTPAQPHQHPYRHLPAQCKPSSNSFQTTVIIRSTPLLLPTRGALHSYPPIDRSSHCRTVFTARRPNDHPPICELRDCVFFGLRRLCYSYAVSLEHKPLCIHATL